MRPGEKLYEELLVSNQVTKTDNKMIFRATEEMIDWDKLEPMLDDLKNLAVDNSDDVNTLLKKIVPEFENNSNHVNDQK